MSMSLEKNKAIIRSLYKALNKKDLASHLAIMDELMAPDFVEHTEQRRGLEANKQWHTKFSGSFPDIHRTIEDIIAEGDKVWVRLTYTGTHKGEFLGLAPTGKKFTFTTVHIYRIVDGKAVERWSVSDMSDFLKQLGAIEPTEKGKELFPEDVK